MWQMKQSKQARRKFLENILDVSVLYNTHMFTNALLIMSNWYFLCSSIDLHIFVEDTLSVIQYSLLSHNNTILSESIHSTNKPY